MELDAAYLTYRPLLLSIAYRMVGSVMHAEDLVQDAFVSIQQKNLLNENDSSIHNLKAYLCKMITNRCLDFLKSSRKKREVYVGPWLPEPIVSRYPYPFGSDAASSVRGQNEDPILTVLLEDNISYAFLVLLERLTPIERAVFILREAFEYDYPTIADFVGKTELGCRKIYSRLKRKIQDEPPVELVSSGQADGLVLRFLHASTTGDMESLLATLSEDIVLYSDGGGKANAAIHPIRSIRNVLAFIQGLASKAGASGHVQPVKVNGQLGFILSSSVDPYPTVVSLEVRGDRIQRIYLLRNPDKLKHLNVAEA